MHLSYGEDDERLIFRFLKAPFFVQYKSSSALDLVTVFPSSVHQFSSPILLLFYRCFHVFLTIANCIYLCFAGEIVFRFLAFGFISHTTRISNNTNFLCKRLVVKNKFRNNLSRFTKLKGFALLLKTWLQLIKNWKIKWWTQF